MKICAVIAEFNPLHNGHEYLLKQARTLSKADAVLVILGGNFTQRGEPSLVSKTVRARQALACGADVVVELPIYGAVLSAQDFAREAVKIASSFKYVTHLVFGSESGDIASISELAKFLVNEPDYFKAEISAALEQGYSLPVSKSRALSIVTGERFKKFTNPESVSELLNKPNNTLAVEYVKALIKLNSSITPLTVQRMDNQTKPKPDTTSDFTNGSAIRKTLYASVSSSGTNSFVRNSATAEEKLGQQVRGLLLSSSSRATANIRAASTAQLAKEERANVTNTSQVRRFMPRESFKLLNNEIKARGFPNLKAFSLLALGTLRTKSAKELGPLYDMAEGLNNKLISTAREAVSLGEMVGKIVSKRYTASRIQRLCLVSILGIKQSIVDELKEQTSPAFIKVIAVKDDPQLLKQLTTTCPLILRHSDIACLNDELPSELIRAENVANAIYAMLLDLNEAELKAFLETNDFYSKTVFV